MESHNSPEVRRFHKRRRKNLVGRRVVMKLTLSEVERAQLHRLEVQTGRSAQEILVSAALSSENGSPVDRRALASSLLQLRYELSSVGNNLNQVAKHANSTGELKPEIYEIVRSIRDQLTSINKTLSELE